MTALIDIGVNLTHAAFRRDLPQVLERARAAGVERMLVTGTNEEASAEAVQLARQHPGLYATAGIHPHHAKDAGAASWPALAQFAASPEVVAIGETGLDFNRDFSPRPDQERALERQLELAVQLGLPVFLHEREAAERMLPILRGCRDKLTGAVIHCFTGDRRTLWGYLDLDLYVGVTGWIADERRGGSLRECVADIPRNRLMIETDAPYLLPRNLKPKPKDGRNEPCFLPHVLARVAECVGRPVEEVGRDTTENAIRFFRLA